MLRGDYEARINGNSARLKTRGDCLAFVVIGRYNFFMRTLLLLSLALCAAPAMAQTGAGKPLLAQADERPTAAEVEAQIKRDLQALFEMTERGGDDTKAYRYIYGARRGFFGARAWKYALQRTLNRSKVQVDEIKLLDRTGDEAQAAVAYSFQSQGDNDGDNAIWQGARQEILNFKLEPKFNPSERLIWQIVPPDAEPPALNADSNVEQEDVLWANIAYHFAQKRVPELKGTPAERSVSNLEILGVGTLRFVLDTAEDFAFDSRYIVDALLPYIASSANFRIPDTNENYTFNANLNRINLGALGEVRQTVLFYKGQNETPIFRYDGRAAICFVDSHVELISPERAKDLIWKP